MTLTQARARIDLLLDKIGSTYFTDAEKDEFLDMAVLEFITEKYSSFEINQLVSDALSPFIQRASIAVMGWPYDVDTNLTDYMHALYITDNDINNTLIKKVNVDERVSIGADPFNRSDINNLIWFWQQEGGFTIQGGPADTFPFTFQLYYITRPAVMPQALGDGDQLPGFIYTHDEICEIAVRKMLSNIESPRYPYQRAEIQEIKQ